MPLKHGSLILSHTFSQERQLESFGASNLGFCAKDRMASFFQLETTHLETNKAQLTMGQYRIMG